MQIFAYLATLQRNARGDKIRANSTIFSDEKKKTKRVLANYTELRAWANFKMRNIRLAYLTGQ